VGAVPENLFAVLADRDSFGIHNLFTPRGGGEMRFASDPRELVGNRVLSLAGLHGYLCFSHVPQPLTIWEGVEQLPPAPLPEPHDDGRDLRELLRAAIEQRLGAEKGVGVYLSGGLDSSLVAALLCELGAKPQLFTLDFGAPYNIELPIARAVAEHLKRPLHVVPARPRHILRALDDTARALPQPYGDGVTVPLYLLGQAARQHVGEVWNGEGGDQLFGGWANKPMIAALTHGDGSGDAAEEIREYLATYHRFYGLTDRLYTPAMRDATAHLNPADWIAPALDRERYPQLLHRLRAANLRLKGAQNIAPRMVALAACHGLRLCAPFFDRDLTAWTFTLPPERILAVSCEKFILKEVAEAYLPRDIVWREKRGMGVPTTEWARRFGPLRFLMTAELSARRLRAEGRFEPALVRGLLGGTDPTPEGAFRKRRVGEKLWTLLMWERWRKVNGVS
jgi:asparagine synthase (glutamine-hydrolysing)